MNLRSGTGTQSKIRGAVETGDELQVLSRGESWTRVKAADGRIGWIPAGYLETEPPPTLRLKQLETETGTLRSGLEKIRIEASQLRESNATPTAADSGQREEIESHFGARVCSIVLEVSDDKSLPKQERKAAQIAHAPHISTAAQSLKLADKISNVFDVAFSTPVDWPPERQLAYFDWAAQVVAGLRGCNAALEALFDEQVARSRESVGGN